MVTAAYCGRTPAGDSRCRNGRRIAAVCRCRARCCCGRSAGGGPRRTVLRAQRIKQTLFKRCQGLLYLRTGAGRAGGGTGRVARRRCGGHRRERLQKAAGRRIRRSRCAGPGSAGMVCTAPSLLGLLSANQVTRLQSLADFGQRAVGVARQVWVVGADCGKSRLRRPKVRTL